MKLYFKRVIASILSAVMIIYLLPLQTFAVNPSVFENTSFLIPDDAKVYNGNYYKFFNGFIQLSTAKYSNKYAKCSEQYRQTIIDYLEDYVPDSGIGLTEEVIGEYKGRAQKNLTKQCWTV